MFRFTLAAVCFMAMAGSALPQDWKPVTEKLIIAEKPGSYNLCGVVVDHKNGDLFICLSDKGLYLSSDQGDSWKRLGTPFKGRTETPGCLMLDPFGGKRIVSAVVYGSPLVVSPDRGETIHLLDKKTTHLDWCAVDWSDPELKFILTLKHEAADMLLVSRDGGKSFKDVGKGYGPAWIFDNKTAVIAQAKSKANPKPGIVRTTDAGETVNSSGEYYAKALPRWHKDRLYWIVEGALISTADQGKSWQKISDLKDGRFGPIFGKSADHLFVLTGAGIVESTDGGKTWNKAIPMPKDFKGVSSNLTWVEYDPTRDTLYVMRMGTELYRWQRK